MCSQVLREKDLLIKFFLRKHGQVKWNFSHLVPPPYLPVPLYPRAVRWSVQACPKIPHCSAFLPNPFCTPVGKQAVFCHLFCLRPRVVMVTVPILPPSDWLWAEGLWWLTMSPEPLHSQGAFGKEGHHSWNVRSFIILLSLSGSEGREFMNF